MKVVIVEDEFVAARNLKRLLSEEYSNIEIIATLQSVEECVEWFSNKPVVDLVFMDIHLADGDVFSVFDQIEIDYPIIFTTAYDKYALKAFEVNSVDYLLKPIDRKKLNKALNKTRLFSKNNIDVIKDIIETIYDSRATYKKNLLIPYKDKFIPLAVDQIAYIHTENKMLKLVCLDGTTYYLDSSLDSLYKELNPQDFFRANRQYIVSHKSISNIIVWFGGKLALNLLVKTPERIIVSRARNKQFRDWYTNNSH